MRADPAARRRGTGTGGREPGGRIGRDRGPGSVCDGRSSAPWRCVRLRPDARDGALAAATEYVRHYASTDYARPLLQVGHAATSALERILDADPAGALATPVRRLLAMAGATTAAAVRLDGREMAVLRLLGARRDKEIARALGLSRDGVRYHVRKIFRKLDVGQRQDAVRRAVALGILPDDGPTA